MISVICLLEYLLVVEVLLGLLLQLHLLLLHNPAELAGRSLLVSLILLLLVGALRSTTGQRLVQEVLVLAGAPRAAAGALGDIGLAGRHVDRLWISVSLR